jgi:hypothetical protein
MKGIAQLVIDKLNSNEDERRQTTNSKGLTSITVVCTEEWRISSRASERGHHLRVTPHDRHLGLLLFFRAAALTSRHLLSSKKKKRRQFAIVEIAAVRLLR